MTLSGPGRLASRRRVDRHDHRRDPGAQPRAAPLDDPGARHAAYELKVPSGRPKSWWPGWSKYAPADLASLNYHTVKRGETITTIARKLKVSRTDLAEANYLKTDLEAGDRPAADGAA